MAGHPACRRVHPHRRRGGLRHPQGPRTRRNADPARRRARALRPDLQDAARPVLRRRRALPSRHQGHPQPPRRPPRPRPHHVSRPEGGAASRLPRRDGRPRRARPDPQHDHAVEHRLPRPRAHAATRDRVPRARCRRRAPVAVHAPAHQLPRPLLLGPVDGTHDRSLLGEGVANNVAAGLCEQMRQQPRCVQNEAGAVAHAAWAALSSAASSRRASWRRSAISSSDKHRPGASPASIP